MRKPPSAEFSVDLEHKLSDSQVRKLTDEEYAKAVAQWTKVIMEIAYIHRENVIPEDEPKIYVFQAAGIENGDGELYTGIFCARSLEDAVKHYAHYLYDHHEAIEITELPCTMGLGHEWHLDYPAEHIRREIDKIENNTIN